MSPRRSRVHRTGWHALRQLFMQLRGRHRKPTLACTFLPAPHFLGNTRLVSYLTS